MITIENVEVFGWEAAIRGMRNPMNSHHKSDSIFYNLDNVAVEDRYKIGEFNIGENDLKLMRSLSKAGNDHAKFLRMINVTCDITAPLYWWKEYSTYKVGTVANSTSTMHKIHAKEFKIEDFSCEHLMDDYSIEPELTYTENYSGDTVCYSSMEGLRIICDILNHHRMMFLETKDKRYWWQMIQLLPSSYNQRRTVQLNYQVLKSMWPNRHNHKLDEWVEFMKWAETLPYFKEICLPETESEVPNV